MKASLDSDTWQVVATVCGDWPERAAASLWDAHRDSAIVCTDLRAAYLAVVPLERHACGGKGDGITRHIERFWYTLG